MENERALPPNMHEREQHQRKIFLRSGFSKISSRTKVVFSSEGMREILADALKEQPTV
ncbi:hypothetical protein [Parageobacillus thermoglucosidasius]|uniref:hypothetical protein n=1 Tax=Parageobacillus TaxID=1906945 RepID=UPI0012FDB514